MVDLSDNKLGEHGARAMAGMLQENTTLVSINLSGNQLNDRAAQHLGLALTTNTKLENLDLSHNALGEPAGSGAVVYTHQRLRVYRRVLSSFIVVCNEKNEMLTALRAKHATLKVKTFLPEMVLK